MDVHHSSLPDISKWNTKKVTDMSYMFAKCSSLSSLPDISNWNTKNVTDITDIFDNSINLLYHKGNLKVMKNNDLAIFRC